LAKSQRLFELVNLLRGRRTAITASALAEVLEVSERTIYRDIVALVGAGVSVEGEAGVGYRLKSGSHVPPLMFEADEVLALMLGLRMVASQIDAELASAATGAERRIRAVLPEALKRALEELPYHIPITNRSRSLSILHGVLRQSVLEKRKVKIDYADQHGAASARVIWPLGILGWGDRWTVLAWCELRQAYRHFRLDRVSGPELSIETFETSPTLSFEHYLQHEKDFSPPSLKT
jgi:predicted DNA-binding transcriptional regulator YafY